VTALDGHDKAIALFDSDVTLKPGNAPSANCGSRIPRRPESRSHGAKPTPLPPDLGTALLVVEFPPLDPTEEAKMRGSIAARSPAGRSHSAPPRLLLQRAQSSLVQLNV
jgi:hypothetical protein